MTKCKLIQWFSYLRRCLKRICIVSWFGFGNFLIKSLSEFTRCFWSEYSEAQIQTAGQWKRMYRAPSCGQSVWKNILTSAVRSTLILTIFYLCHSFSKYLSVVVMLWHSESRYSLMALTKSLKEPYVKSGSGSSLKNILRAPVVTWMSSHLLSFRSTFSSAGGRRTRQQCFTTTKLIMYFTEVKQVLGLLVLRQDWRRWEVKSYRDSQQSAASVSLPGSRSLCISHQYWDLQDKEREEEF